MTTRRARATSPTLDLTVRAPAEDVARVAYRFAAAYIAVEHGWQGQDGLQLMAARDGALADLLLVTGFLDVYEGVVHTDRPERVVPVRGGVL